MSDYELRVLRWLDGHHVPEPTPGAAPGAALNQAVEALRGNGLVDLEGNLTPRGRERLNPVHGRRAAIRAGRDGGED